MGCDNPFEPALTFDRLLVVRLKTQRCNELRQSVFAVCRQR